MDKNLNLIEWLSTTGLSYILLSSLESHFVLMSGLKMAYLSNCGL